MNFLHLFLFACTIGYGIVQFVWSPERKLKALIKSFAVPQLLLFVALGFYEQGIRDASRAVRDVAPSSLRTIELAQTIDAKADTASTVRAIIVVLALIAGALYCYASLHPKGENGEEVM